jgi:hypothetical protein
MLDKGRKEGMFPDIGMPGEMFASLIGIAMPINRAFTSFGAVETAVRNACDACYADEGEFIRSICIYFDDHYA